MKKTLGIVLSVLVGLLVLGAAPAGAAAGSCYGYSSPERSFAKKINNARNNAGKRGLKLDPQLSQVATKQAKTMAWKNVLFHTPSSKLRRRVTNWTTLGENVGYGSTVPQLHTLFMQSPGHKANILGSGFSFVGVGVAKARGYIWVTVVFEGSRNPGTTLPMPSC